MGVGGQSHIWVTLSVGQRLSTHCRGGAHCLRMNCFYTFQMVSLDVAQCNQNKEIITLPLLFTYTGFISKIGILSYCLRKPDRGQLRSRSTDGPE